MDDKEALKILIELLKKPGLSLGEIEAIKYAIGVLSWTTLRHGAIKSIRDKKIEKRKNLLIK